MSNEIIINIIKAIFGVFFFAIICEGFYNSGK